MSVTELKMKTESEKVDIKKLICDYSEFPLEKARALPAEAFIDEEYYQWEEEYILKSSWLSVAHVSQISEPGDYINLDFLGEKLSVVRDNNGEIKVFSRVCVHRGVDMMPPEYGHKSSGNCQQFRCPYHHWVYGLDGNLKGAPFMKDHEEVVNEKLKLHEFRSAIWQGFVFVDFSGKCEPIEKQFGGLEQFIGRWRMSELEMVADIEWDCSFNWKVIVENFMEPYHHVGAHHSIFQPTLPAQHCWPEPEGDHYLVCHLPLAKQLQDEVKEGKQNIDCQKRVP